MIMHYKVNYKHSNKILVTYKGGGVSQEKKYMIKNKKLRNDLLTKFFTKMK